MIASIGRGLGSVLGTREVSSQLLFQVAASRAISQNNNLKKQLEELQEAVVHLVSNISLSEKRKKVCIFQGFQVCIFQP